ncbi:MAG: CvpA family protein [Deltaproteobacteria bacterium]|jgi:membrane protein required for colicin V production|nr:CvpA family protein [Deltaproteobacteria bacterium]
MNALDIALAVVLAYFLIRGIFRGLVKEVVGILGLFIAFWVASAYWQLGADQLTPLTDRPGYRGVLSFAAIYLIVYFLIGLLSIFVDKIVKLAVTPLVSSAFGGALGLLKGAALCLVVLTAVMGFLYTKDDFFTNSKAWTYARPLTEEIRTWIPERIKGFIEERQAMVSGSLSPRLQAPAAGTAPPGSPAAPSQAAPLGLQPPVDYPTLMAIVRAHPLLITPAWMEKLDGMNPQSVDQATVRDFIRDHPNLFSPAPSRPWPQPDAPAE